MIVIFCFIAVHCYVQVCVKVTKVLHENECRVHKTWSRDMILNNSRINKICYFIFFSIFHVSYFEVCGIYWVSSASQLLLEHKKLKPRPLQTQGIPLISQFLLPFIPFPYLFYFKDPLKLPHTTDCIITVICNGKSCSHSLPPAIHNHLLPVSRWSDSIGPCPLHVPRVPPTFFSFPVILMSLCPVWSKDTIFPPLLWNQSPV